MTPAPTNRLIAVTLALGVPWITVCGYVLRGIEGVAVGVLVFLIPVLVDLWLGRGRGGGMRFTLAPLVRATQGHNALLAGRADGGNGLVRAALRLPDSFVDAPEMVEGVADATGCAVLEWEFIPVERGAWRFGEVFFETLSPGGLWSWRGSAPVSGEVRVFPDMHKERGVLAPLFLRKPASGLHRVRQMGKGREFAQLREYAPGDSYDEIYWKGTARRHHPVTKVFQLERTQDIHLVIDASRRSGRVLSALENDSPYPQTQMDRFVRATLAMALSAIQQGDRPGMSVFRNGMESFIRPGAGRPQFDAIRRGIYAVQPSAHSPDFSQLFGDLQRRLRHRCLVVFFSDLDDPVLAEQFVEELPVLTRRHVVLVAQLSAPAVRPLFHRDAGADSDAAVYERFAGHLLWEGARGTLAKLRALGAHVVHSPAEALVADAVSAYVNIKRRQLL